MKSLNKGDRVLWCYKFLQKLHHRVCVIVCIYMYVTYFILYLVTWLWQVTYTSFSIKFHTKITNTIYWIHLNVKTFVDKMNKLCSLEIHFYTRRFWVDISNCPNIIIYKALEIYIPVFPLTMKYIYLCFRWPWHTDPNL